MTDNCLLLPQDKNYFPFWGTRCSTCLQLKNLMSCPQFLAAVILLLNVNCVLNNYNYMAINIMYIYNPNYKFQPAR